MVEVVAAAISAVVVAISLGLRVVVLRAIALHNTKETTSRGPEIIFGTEITSGTVITSGTTEISSLEILSITTTHSTGTITTHTTDTMIPTTAIMTATRATITTDNTHQPK